MESKPASLVWSYFPRLSWCKGLLLLLLLNCYGASRHEEQIKNGGWSVGGSLAGPGPCTVARADASALSVKEFLRLFAKKEPVVLDGLRINEEFSHHCTRAALLSAFGHRRIKLTTASSHSYLQRPVRLDYYIKYMMGAQDINTPGNETLYHFGDTDRVEWKDLFDLYNFPPYPIPGLAPIISFGLAGVGTGVPMHFHGPTFGEVIFGRKRWFFYPPTWQANFDPNRTTLKWLIEDYPRLAEDKRPTECTVGPGQVIYFPDRWWHSTLNIDTSVFVSTFLAPEIPSQQSSNQTKDSPLNT